MTRLHGKEVALRPLEERDLPRLAEIMGEPEAARWWGESSVDSLRDDFLGPDSDSGFAVEVAGSLVGVVSFWEHDEADCRYAGMDIVLGEAHTGRGLGPDALRALARHLFGERGHWRLVIDPDAANERAIRAYELVGFRPVGVMRRYQRRRDGSFRDALLMDLLPEELR